MTTVGIISDTHGCTDPRIAAHFDGCDEIWHAGDIGSPDVLAMLRGVCGTVRAVSGNIDGALIRRECPELIEFEVEGLKVLLTHIGGYPGRYSPGMRLLLQERRPGLMVCGHSHILKVKYDPGLGLLHINPGAAGTQGWQRERTLIRLTIDAARPTALEIITLAK